MYELLLDELLAQGFRREYPKGHILIGAGEVPRAIFYVETGAVIITYDDITADNIPITGILGPGQFGGVESYFTRSAARTETVTAERSRIIEIPYGGLKRLLCQPAAEKEALLRFLGKHLATLYDTQSERLAYCGSHRVESRTMYWLSQLASAIGKPHALGTAIPLSRKDLARFIGCVPHVAYRVLLRLERRGALHRFGSMVVVPKSAPD